MPRPWTLYKIRRLVEKKVTGISSKFIATPDIYLTLAQ